MSRRNPPFATRLLAADPAGIAEAARLIREGFPVAVPTETVYGLAADAGSAEAVARIYEAKGRPSFNPLIVHVADPEAAERLASFDEPARRIARAFWPGAVTLVLPLKPEAGLAPAVTAGLETVALRCPAHPAMRALLEASGRPLAAPSANRSGAISPTEPAHVLASLGGRIPLVLDAGRTDLGLESTIVSVAADGLALLRAGPIGLADLAAAAGLGETQAPARIQAPGQLASHYAPSKPLRLDATSAGPDEWLIGFGAIAGDENLSPSGDASEAAANLFAALHRADASSRPKIAVAPIPAEGPGQAMNDRLRRAAAPRHSP